MKKTLIFFVALCLVGYYASAQVSKLRVMSLKGSVSIKKSSTKKWATARVSDYLTSGDEIKLADDAYCSLYGSNNAIVDLSDAGTYSFKKLAERANKKKKSSASVLSESIEKGITSTSSLFNKKSLKDNSSIPGAGQRAVGENDDESGTISSMTGADNRTSSAVSSAAKLFASDNSKEIGIISPRNTYISGESILFEWDKPAGATNNRITISDRNGNEVFVTSTPESSYRLDIASSKLQKGQNYFWCVGIDELKSTQYQFQILSDSSASIINLRMKEYTDDFDDPPCAFECAMLAEYFSAENLQSNATEYYEMAIKRSNGADDYKLLYAKHLVSIGLQKKADKLVAETYLAKKNKK